MPRMSRSVLTAGFILLALLVYFVFRGITRPSPEAQGAVATETEAPAETIPAVVVRTVTSQPHTVFASLKGRTEPDRTVTVRSETTGTVTNARVAEGRTVARGTVLCGLGVESRAARVAEAEAAVAANRLDYTSALTLEEKGWATSNRAASIKAALDRAEAGLAAARIELAKTTLRAPFAGVFETRMAETGDFLSPGAACGVIVDLDPIIVAVDATESQMRAITNAATAQITLSDGSLHDGTVRYIARTAHPQTRTFRIEVEAPNRDHAIAGGLTASVRIALGEAPAMLLTPASLVLHDDGRVGVRYVDGDNTIRFTEVAIVDDAPTGIWVTGIPENARLISAGQDYLREGVRVTVLTVPDLTASKQTANE